MSTPPPKVVAQTIAQLTQAAPLTGAEFVAVSQNGTTYRTTVAMLNSTPGGSTPNSLAGYNSMGAYANVTIGSGLVLANNILSSTGQGVSVTQFGAVPDCLSINDVVCTSGSATITSASAGFLSSRDYGKIIKIYDIANNAYIAIGTILSVTNSTTVVMSVTASANVSSGNAICYWGTDNAAAINAAFTYAATLISQVYGGINAPSGRGYARVTFPVVPGVGDAYLFASTLTPSRNILIDADAMLFNAIACSASDRAWAINNAAGLQINRLLMECGGGMGVHIGTLTVQNSSFINQIQLWNVGLNYNGSLTPTSQTALELYGYDFTITEYWAKGGNISINLYQASDVRMNLVEIIGAASGFVIAGCENTELTNCVFDTCSYQGLSIDGSHSIYVSANAFSVNSSGLTYVAALGVNDHTNVNKNINITFNAQRCGGILAYIAYTQDAVFNLLGTNAANYSAAGVAITQMVQYGSGNAGMITVNATRDNISSPVIANFTGSRTGIYWDYYDNAGTWTAHLYGTFTNP